MSARGFRPTYETCWRGTGGADCAARVPRPSSPSGRGPRGRGRTRSARNSPCGAAQDDARGVLVQLCQLRHGGHRQRLPDDGLVGSRRTPAAPACSTSLVAGELRHGRTDYSLPSRGGASSPCVSAPGCASARGQCSTAPGAPEGGRRRARRREGGRSFDDLIRAQQQRRRDREAERLGGLQVDHQLELRGLLDGEVARLGTLDDLVST